MASIVQFVDQISASPTVRLDLNTMASGLMVDTQGADFSPPPQRRVVVTSPLYDGDLIPASAYGNRTIKLPLRLLSATTDTGATALQNLARELARPNNILKVQLEGATSPTFFQTFAAPDYTMSMVRLMLTTNTVVALEIPAGPFGLGLKESIAGVTVTDDPVAASNGMSWNITGVKGDVETPLVLTLPTGDLYDAGNPISVLAVRRRGNPANVPFGHSAEFMTLGTDTTLPGNDAAMSGTGSNYARVSFGTNASMVRRLYLDPFPTAVSYDTRGRYRVFVLVRRSSATGDIGVQLGYTSSGSALVQNDWTSTAYVTARHHIDLGLIQFPTGQDPVCDGYSNAEVLVKGRYIELRAERLSGTSTLDFDYLLFVPADDNMALIDWGDAASTSDQFVIDGIHEMIYTQTTGAEVYGSAPSVVAGGFPMVSPGVTNRIFFIRRVGRGATATKTTTTVISAAYWPRYLTIRPAST